MKGTNLQEETDCSPWKRCVGWIILHDHIANVLELSHALHDPTKEIAEVHHSSIGASEFRLLLPLLLLLLLG